MIALKWGQFVFDNKEPHTNPYEDNHVEMTNDDIEFHRQCEQEHYELEMERSELHG